MKSHYILECKPEFEFVVLAINSHSKGYTLCWNLNETFGLSFEMTAPHSVSENLLFTKYSTLNNEGFMFNLITNRSKKGYLIPSQKSVNYFLLVYFDDWRVKKKEFLYKLRKISSILLVFELDLDKIKKGDRFYNI